MNTTLKQGKESKTYYDILPYLYHLSPHSKGKAKNNKSGIYVDDSHLTHGILFPGANVYKEQSNTLSIFKMPLDEYLDPNNGKSLEEKNRLDAVFKGIMQELDLEKDKDAPIKFEAGKLNMMSLSPIQHRRLAGIVVKHESEWKSTRAADFAKVCALYRANQKIELAECIDKRVKDLSISVKVGQFDTDREAYYVHPLGMVGWLSENSQDCIPFKLAQEIALKVSGGFEGKTPRYDTLADNFDGAGMSWGIIQFNFGQDTLGPLLRKMRSKNVSAFNSAFSNPKDLETLNSALDSNKIDQINWAKNMQSKSNKTRWKNIFNNLAQIDEFNDIQLEAVKPYDDEAVRTIKWMRGLYPDLMKKVELKTFIALHDLAIQQGSIKNARGNIVKKCNSSPPKTQDEFIRIVVSECAITVALPWRADCLSRRLGILNKKVTTATHSGKISSRDNINFKLIEDVFICDL